MHPSLLLFLHFDKFKSTIRIVFGCTIKKLEAILVLEETRKEKKPYLTCLTWLSFPHPCTPAPSKSVLSSPSCGLCPQTPTPIHSIIGATNVGRTNVGGTCVGGTKVAPPYRHKKISLGHISTTPI